MRILTTLLLAFVVGRSVLSAETVSSAERLWDLGVGIGQAGGGVTQTTSNGVVRRFSYGGIPVRPFINTDLHRKASLRGGLDFIVDTKTLTITRLGVDGTISYHLWGGPRRLMLNYPTFDLVTRSPSNFSVGCRVGFYRYDAATSVRDVKLSGAAFHITPGLEYRFDLSEGSSLMLEMAATLFSVSVSSDSVSPALLETALSWRFFL